jgi:hypothetical protein
MTLDSLSKPMPNQTMKPTAPHRNVFGARRRQRWLSCVSLDDAQHLQMASPLGSCSARLRQHLMLSPTQR